MEEVKRWFRFIEEFIVGMPQDATQQRGSSLRATGVIRVFLTQNIGTRYFPDDRDGRKMYENFRQLRGTPELARGSS